MYDIVIPYLKNNSGELELCTELIKKNFPHRNIYVVEIQEMFPYRLASHIDQILKLKWAIENLDITPKFYLFNDDFFVLEPIASTPYFYRGTLEEHIYSRRFGDTYTNALKKTSAYLGEGALSYEVHLPFLFSKDLLYILINDLKEEIKTGDCPLIRSTYGNLYNVGGSILEDVKNVKDFEGKVYLSTTEQSFKRAIGDYVRSKI